MAFWQNTAAAQSSASAVSQTSFPPPWLQQNAPLAMGQLAAPQVTPGPGPPLSSPGLPPSCAVFPASFEGGGGVPPLQHPVAH
jgi:hypothetical protein